MDRELRDLERQARQGLITSDELRRARARRGGDPLQEPQAPLKKVRRFKFSERALRISIRPQLDTTRLKECVIKYWYVVGPDSRCPHQHRNRDLAKKCAIRRAKKKLATEVTNQQ